MFRVAEIVSIITGLVLVGATVNVSSVKQLPSADLNSGLGYELLLAAIEAMQQDIMDTRKQVREQSQLMDVVKAEIERKQQTMEKNIQDVLQRSLVDLNQQIQTSLRKDSLSAEQLQQRIEQVSNRTEQAVDQLKQSTKQEFKKMYEQLEIKIAGVQNSAPSTPFERPFLHSVRSMPNTSTDNRIYSSCQEAPTSGVMRIRVQSASIPSFRVACEKNSWGSWMVIHRRFDGSLDFNRNWSQYRYGFGTIDSEYWLGLEKMHQITLSGSYELLIVMKRSDDSDWYAHYQQFAVGSSAEKYKLQLSGFYRGSVADSMASSNGMAFSTPDVDNDMDPNGSCAQSYSSGWWFNMCFGANLNGVYRRGKIDNTMQWNEFGDKECLKEVVMMIRPSPIAIQGGGNPSYAQPGSGHFYSEHSFWSSSTRNSFP